MEMTFADGSKMSLHVDLAAHFQGSVHASQLTCTDCHGAHNIVNPHEKRAMISRSCATCHSNQDVPACADCHTSHQVQHSGTALSVRQGSVISYLWQFALHSGTMGLILYIWVHRVGLPSGRTRQHLLGLLLVLPLVTAAVPWRSSVEFGERVAWLNSARLLAIPLPFGDDDIHVSHIVALGGILTVLLTVWQELVPALHHVLQSTGPSAGPPPDLVAAARSRAGWEHCAVRVTDETSIQVATTGRPGRPRLVVSRGALAALSAEELDAVLTHEHAHWQQGRWWRTHVLFVIRLIQSYNPVALWAFREYCIEDEIACDAAAVAGRDRRLLARVLLRAYQTTDGRDLAARGALRKRVDVILAGGPADAPPPPFVLPAVSLVMLMVLPWLV